MPSDLPQHLAAAATAPQQRRAADLFADALDASFAAYRIGRGLRAAWPDLSLVEGRDTTFDVDGFAAAGHCTLTPCAGVHLELHTTWNAPFLVEPDVRDTWTPPYVPKTGPKRGDGSLSRSTANGVYDVRWDGHDLVVALAAWSEGTCNLLDGFAPNAGLLVLATTNHPERLDPAILERPSRFDRKYHFPLPVGESRAAFLARWTERLDPHLKLTAEQHATLVERTEGFSFAYLKELCLAAVLRWMKHRPSDGLFPILDSQLEVLRAQMRSEGAGEAPPKPRVGHSSALQELIAALQRALPRDKEEGEDDEAQ
jgi:hypothetical protein